MPSTLPDNILFIDLEPANRAPGFESHWYPDTALVADNKRYVKLEDETRSSLGLVSKSESFLTSPTWLNSRALGELIQVKFGSNITETFIVQMHPLTADRRLAWVEDTTQRFDNRVAHWMIQLGHKYSDNLGYWYRQRSKSCPAGTLRPRGLLRQLENEGSTPTATPTPDAPQTVEEDDAAHDDYDDAPSDTNCWSDVVQFSQDYINKKKTLADAPRLKCCICQEELYYVGFNSRRGDRHMEAACVTSCGHIIGAMCYEKWHIGCLIRGATYSESEDGEEEEEAEKYRLGTVTRPLCRTMLHCQKCGEPYVPWDAADQLRSFAGGMGCMFLVVVT